MSKTVDLKHEQQVTLTRPRLNYCLAARFFFFAMDCVTGKQTTLSKAKLIESFASVPYRAWEGVHYVELSKKYNRATTVSKGQAIIDWGRWAQDNEYGHLLVLHEKMTIDHVRDAWYLIWPVRGLMLLKYRILSFLLARISLKAAWIFNAQFEDHAEHVYAQAVVDNPEWELQGLGNAPLTRKLYPQAQNWADVFRAISLDERNHRNESFRLAGKSDCVC